MDHPIWNGETYRIFAGFDDSHLFIDIDDKGEYNVVSSEYAKTFNDFKNTSKLL
ncbi:hypothetical protein [Methanolobus vulcani]|uniref:hypothetical protein n=1 Tax=Methanolobus vulcani TaxID=38026 RepID=UPI0012B694C4|nr:hypothetical protein [Methanolobus vulcani]